MSEIPVWAQILGMLVGPSGVVWATVRTTLNGTVARVQRIETTVDSISKDVTHVRERVARLEGRK